jgi:type VI secretion system secreted protein Hcp
MANVTEHGTSYPAYMTVTGQKQGNIKGTSKVHKDAIDILGYTYEVISPRDPMSGLPTGQRMHKPIVITKNLDKSSPNLFTALCTNENLSKVQICYCTRLSGKTEEFLKLTLSNASIAELQVEGERDLPHETISFTFTKIEMEFNAIDDKGASLGGWTQASDDWVNRS